MGHTSLILKRLRMYTFCGALALASMLALADDGLGGAVVKLGMSAPLSGPNGAYGLAMKEGAEVFFAELNAAGGVHGRKVELVTLDDGYETARAVANTKQLIDAEKVFALMAFYGSSPTTAAMEVFSSARVPLVGTISGAETLRAPVNRYMFHLRASYADETEAIVKNLVTLGIERVAVLYQADGFGQSGLDGVTQALKKYNLVPAAVGSVERNSLGVSAAVDAIAKVNPQAVVMVTLYKPTAAFVRAMRKAGKAAHFITLSPVGADLLVQELGTREAHGLAISQVMPHPWNEGYVVVRQYQQVLLKFAKHRNFSYYGLEGYLNARLMVEALRRAGRDLTREKLVNALEAAPFDLGGYRVDFSSASHQGSRFVDLTVIGSGGRILR